MGKRFKECTLDQPLLLPPSLQEWIPEDHLARFIAEVADELDLSGIYAEYERRDGRGLAAYHPLLVTRLLLYGYCIGEVSSRRIEQATYDQLAFRYLAADQHPDHDTIASFRKQHLESLGKRFLQALRLCQKAGLVRLGHVAIDGTKIRAAASSARSLKHAQLSEREEYWKSTIQSLLEQAAATDEAEDRRWGRGQSERSLPAELAHAEARLQRLQQAKRELEEEAAKQQNEAANAQASEARAATEECGSCLSG